MDLDPEVRDLHNPLIPLKKERGRKLCYALQVLNEVQ